MRAWRLSWCCSVPANALSLPVRTMALISLSSSYFLSASFSSTKSALDRALRALGLFKVTVWDQGTVSRGLDVDGMR